MTAVPVPFGRTKVIFVDDDPHVLRSMSRYLAHRGLEVISTSSPFGVSALVLQNSPQVIVLDVTMPGLSGDALAQLLRNHKEIRCPIILYSALLEDKLRLLAMQTPGTLYVNKGDGAERLYSAICEATRRA